MRRPTNATRPGVYVDRWGGDEDAIAYPEGVRVTFYLPPIPGKPYEEGQIDVWIEGRTITINTGTDRAYVLSSSSNHLHVTTDVQARQELTERDEKIKAVAAKDEAERNRRRRKAAG